MRQHQATKENQEEANKILSSLDSIKPGPFGKEVSNSAVVRKVGNALAAKGWQISANKAKSIYF